MSALSSSTRTAVAPSTCDDQPANRGIVDEPAELGLLAPEVEQERHVASRLLRHAAFAVGPQRRVEQVDVGCILSAATGDDLAQPVDALAVEDAAEAQEAVGVEAQQLVAGQRIRPDARISERCPAGHWHANPPPRLNLAPV